MWSKWACGPQTPFWGGAMIPDNFANFPGNGLDVDEKTQKSENQQWSTNSKEMRKSISHKTTEQKTDNYFQFFFLSLCKIDLFIFRNSTFSLFIQN